ncbi:MAG: Hsp70 family protein [Chlamydiales bacterium]|nr:Hsp70 family protein [Chlamydiales bacterium]
MRIHSRYIIGIDLGTTNCSVAYVDTKNEHFSGKHIRTFLIPQLTMPGLIESKELLPSFCYLAGDQEFPKGSLELPWGVEKRNVVGYFAKDEGVKTPTKLVQSAKSWLCNASAYRREKILPPECFDVTRRLSPVEASALYLRHIIESWNASIAKGDLAAEFEEQDIILTVPASFDEVARVLTIEAAKMAGLSKVTLLEEPQAAFYSWICANEKSAITKFQENDVVLVVDIGGGTTDFSLIEVSVSSGNLGFQRMAVGNHLLLGGDNMDFALAHYLEGKINGKLDIEQQLQLTLLARNAKEEFFSLQAREKISLFFQGKGSKVISGSVGLDVKKEEVIDFLKEGFFKEEPFEEALKLKKKSGIRPLSLDFEAEPSILKHLAEFLHINKKVPTHVLFNGGSTKPELFRNAVLRSISQWFNVAVPEELVSTSLDLAVARGSAYFGRVQRGLGIKIKAGLARSYYLEIECKDTYENKEKKALALLVKGEEDGFIYESKHEFIAKAGSPISFQLMSSNVRLQDVSGDVLTIVPGDMLFLPPIQTVLRYGKSVGPIQVHLCAELTPIGIVQLWLQSVQSEHKWLLEFQIKSHEGKENAIDSLEKKRMDETHEVEHLQKAAWLLKEQFCRDPKNIVVELESVLGTPKQLWPPSVLRGLFDALLELKTDFFASIHREVRAWNLLGFFLRPGLGYPLDDFRIKELWKLILAEYKKQKPVDVVIQRWICYRRIAGGLNKGQQLQLASEVLPALFLQLEQKSASKNKMNPYEYAESLRLIASLECINLDQKVRLGNLLVKRVVEGKALDVDLWAIGRLGTRAHLTSSFIHAIPSKIVASWLETILDVKTMDFSAKVDLIEKLARKVERKELNMPEELISSILVQIAHHPCYERLYHLLKEVQSLELVEQEELFGDQLPPGLTLVLNGN